MRNVRDTHTHREKFVERRLLPALVVFCCINTVVCPIFYLEILINNSFVKTPYDL